MSNQVATANQQRGVDLLKGILNAPSVQEQFKNALDKNSDAFITSIIDLYNSSASFKQCDPKAIVMECLKAATLKMPIVKSLGFAYIIPFNNSKRDDKGNWIKVMEPTFQLGYKGYIQLAQRAGQYRILHSDTVYEGELRKVDKLTGEISFDGERTSDKVVGYFAYFELLNGFSKTLYMTVEQIARHAKSYSSSIKFDKKVTIESLIALANIETNSSSVGWVGNFNEMALKTVLRLLLSKWGYLSIEMQSAIDTDIKSDSRDVRDEAVEDVDLKPISIDTEYEEVKDEAPAQDEAPY